jgi:glycosyltransferase involved in cell wall biosynthesis
MRVATPDFLPTATLRVSFPYHLTTSAAPRTLVYGTAEYGVVPRSYLAPGTQLRDALGNPSLMIVTPSRWSAEGFRRLGFDDSRIAIIPHGVAVDLFRPRPESRRAMRQELGLSGFVFMAVGAMTGNKGMDILLRAFAAVAERRSDVRLLLKGADRLYTSQALVRGALGAMPRSQADLVVKRLVYGGEALSVDRMSVLYQAADAYVSPYRAEGFNLPVLEAAACGVPVICTRGGATDDFIADGFAKTIESRLKPVQIEDENGAMLEPDLDHLIDLMDRMVADEDFRRSAATAGPPATPPPALPGITRSSA